MADRSAPPPARLPTLTEVVQVDAAAPTPRPPVVDAVDEARIVAAVMSQLQQRIDLMYEYRLREAMAPVLARLTEAVIRDARDELARTLRDIVARAVAQELSRQRPR